LSYSILNSTNYDTIEDVFFQYKNPVNDLSNIKGFLSKNEPEGNNLYIATYFTVLENQKIMNIKFDRLINLSSPYFKNKTNIWKTLEDSIKATSKYWLINILTLDNKFVKDTVINKNNFFKYPLPFEMLIVFCFSDDGTPVQFKKYIFIETYKSRSTIDIDSLKNNGK
jgi:hypothetical protein